MAESWVALVAMNARYERTSGAWIIAATNQNLARLVEQGLFRADLSHRLVSTHIELPALRERKEDILLLAEHFLQKYAHEFGVRPKRLSPEAERILLSYDWPGNVRELRNKLRATLITVPEDTNFAHHLDIHLPAHRKPNRILTLAEIERQHIYKVHRHTGGNKRQTARLLGIGLNTLKRKLNGNR